MSDSTAKLLIVGLGNIGFRHLQGLSSVAHRVDLWGIDSHASALDRASAEWAGLGRPALGFAQEVGAAACPFDLVILATSAKGRLQLIRSVIAREAPRHMIIEKVAFQTTGDMREAGALAGRSGTNIFVNCPRRLWPLYRALRDALDGQTFDLTVRGRNLGLACNGIHFVDLLQFLAGDSEVEIGNAALEGIVASKRSGFHECFGRLRLRTANRCGLDLSVRDEDPAVTVVELTRADGLRLIIDEARGCILAADGGLVSATERPPFQSELTGGVVAELLDSGSCGLATLAESAAAHEPFLRVLGAHFAANGFDISDGVPIT